ncbi:hypothetical protein AB0B28_08235 [Glycomyces sp. NPDC046736]|uniref:hypothetical protein n=1 Tax=Glycomyces sp. NPDC046736 TaxID=3155615 RepID=UPI0033E140FB
MRETDAVVLVAFVASMQPAQQFSKYTPDAWSMVLADVPADLETAKAAVVRLAKRKAWFSPGEIRAEILRALPPSALAAPAPERAIEWRAEAANAARIERNARGAALVRQALAEATPYRLGREDAPEIPENLRRAREAAVAYRAQRRRQSDPASLARTAGEALTQIHRARKATP